MSFSTEWENIYKNGNQITKWPWSDLVSYFYTHVKVSKKLRVLELGCGSGANIPFFMSLGIDYYAIEGSTAAVDLIIKSYPNLQGKVVVGDFTNPFPFDLKFDLIFDRASITHNDLNSIVNTINFIYTYLKKNGIFIGIDWFSESHSEYKNGSFFDSNTKYKFTSGQFLGVGKVHFSDEQHLKKIFSKFTFINLLHKINSSIISKNLNIVASYNFVVVK